jgi:hypothetical protein
MKRQVSWALLAGGIALATATATAVPAAAATSGSETFKGAIVTSGVSGTRTVITTVIIVKGAFSGVGRIVEVENQPGDEDRVSRDDLVFARGSMHLVNTTLGNPEPSVNPRSCVATITIHQTGEIVGGTGKFAAAKGSFTATVTARAVLARNPDGSCSLEHDPLHEVDLITATGTLSF